MLWCWPTFSCNFPRGSQTPQGGGATFWVSKSSGARAASARAAVPATHRPPEPWCLQVRPGPCFRAVVTDGVRQAQGEVTNRGPAAGARAPCLNDQSSDSGQVPPLLCTPTSLLVRSGNETPSPLRVLWGLNEPTACGVWRAADLSVLTVAWVCRAAPRTR